MNERRGRGDGRGERKGILGEEEIGRRKEESV